MRSGASNVESQESKTEEDEGSVYWSWWRFIASKAESLLVPCICPINLFPLHLQAFSFSSSSSITTTNNTTVIGTILLCSLQDNTRNLKLCFQEEHASTATVASPFLLLDLPTAGANCELEGGPCRIVLECQRAHSGGGPLLGTATWTVYFNGRRAGFAWKREDHDHAGNIGRALQSLRSVSAGIGIHPPSPPSTSTMIGSMQTIEYFRGRFQRVVGSPDSESYHLIEPAGCLAHELSFFFVRL